jgi:hypothetical protein
MLILVVVFLTVRWVARLGAAPRRVTIPWLCGYAVETEGNRDRATHLYGEINRSIPSRALRAKPLIEPSPLGEAPTKPVTPWSLEKN